MALGLRSDYSLALAYILLSMGALVVLQRIDFPGQVRLLPATRAWRVGVAAAAAVAVILLLWLSQAGPVSQISGRARSSLEVISVAALGPIAEELLFRGVIWSLLLTLARSRKNDWIALSVSSLLFGLMHVGYWLLDRKGLSAQTALHVTSMFAAGAVFGSVRMSSKSLLAPIASHALGNCLILALQT